MSEGRRLTQLETVTNTADAVVKMVLSFSDRKIKKGDEIIIKLSDDEVITLGRLLQSIARSQIDGLKALGENTGVPAEDIIAYFRKVICKNLSQKTIQELDENLTSINNCINENNPKVASSLEHNMVAQAKAAVSEGLNMYNDIHVNRFSPDILSDEQKVNPVLLGLHELDSNKMYDISYNENKDENIKKFIVKTLGTKPLENKENQPKDYTVKDSVKTLLAHLKEIDQLPEAKEKAENTKEIKYYLKIFALMVVMGNTTQVKRDSKIVNSIVRFSRERLRLPVKDPSVSTLRVLVNQQLENTLLFGEFIDQKIENQHDRNMPSSYITSVKSASHKTYLGEALVEVIDALRKGCKSEASEKLYATIMLQFTEIKDEKFKNGILLMINSRGRSVTPNN